MQSVIHSSSSFSGAVFHWHPPDAGMSRRKKSNDNWTFERLLFNYRQQQCRKSLAHNLVEELLNQLFHQMRWLVFHMEIRDRKSDDIFTASSSSQRRGNLLGTLSASSAQQKWVWRLAGNFISLRLPFWRMLGCWRTAGLHVSRADASELLLLLRLWSSGGFFCTATPWFLVTVDNLFHFLNLKKNPVYTSLQTPEKVGVQFHPLTMIE